MIIILIMWNIEDNETEFDCTEYVQRNFQTTSTLGLVFLSRKVLREE